MEIFNVNDKNAIRDWANVLLDNYDVVEIVFADLTEETLIARHVETSTIDMSYVTESKECPFCYEELSENNVCENCKIQFVDESW